MKQKNKKKKIISIPAIFADRISIRMMSRNISKQDVEQRYGFTEDAIAEV